MKENTAVCTKRRKPDEENDDDESSNLKGKREKAWVKNQTLFREITLYIYEEVEEVNPRFGFKIKSKRVVKTESSIEEYKLEEVSEEELYKIREYKLPAFIMKENDRYFYAWIPFELRLLGSMTVEHKCAPRNDVCKRLTPLPDNLGGCAKVRAKNPRIEKYDWITKGYESVHTVCDCFIVLECEHHELESGESKLSNKIANVQNSNFFNSREHSNSQTDETFFESSDPFLEDAWGRIPKFFY